MRRCKNHLNAEVNYASQFNVENLLGVVDFFEPTLYVINDLERANLGAAHARIILLAIGSNDLWSGTKPEDLFLRLKNAVLDILSSGSIELIAFMQVVPRYSHDLRKNEAFRVKMNEFNSLCFNFAKITRRFMCIKPFGRYYENNLWVQYDNIHPKADVWQKSVGYALLDAARYYHRM